MNNENSIDTILENYEIYLGCNPENTEHFNVKPFGKQVKIVDVNKANNGVFFDLLNQLDGILYGDKSLAMDKWVSLDCGLVPSGFVGLAKYVDDCPKEILEQYDIPDDYKGLVPITEYCAIPCADGSWLGHTCGTLVKGKKIGLFSKILGMLVFKIKNYKGVAQYYNNAVKTHSTISNLLMKTAITPAHSEPDMTFVYEHKIDQDEIKNVFGSKKQPKQYSFLLDPNDMKQKQEMQNNIENGVKYYITYPGQIYVKGKLYVPIITE